MSVANSGSVGRGRTFVKVQRLSAKSIGSDQSTVVRFTRESERRGARLPTVQHTVAEKLDVSGFGGSTGVVE